MFYNTHIHTLNKNHIPDKFLPLKLMRLLSRNRAGRIIANLLSWANPFSSKDLLDRYAAFLTVAGGQSQFEIFQKLFLIYKDFATKNDISIDDLRFVILSMDLEFMGAGSIKCSFEDQLIELEKLSLNPAFKDLILPFMFLDPRRDYPRTPATKDGELTKLFERFVIKGNFKGVKLYPNLGYYPDDDRLSYIYYELEKYKKPVISHCSKGGIYLRNLKQEECVFFADPENWRPVLENYPDLKICLAHLSGDKDLIEFFKPGLRDYRHNWLYKILEMLKEYSNLYVDISYALWRFEYFALLKLLLDNPNYRERILFGSDYYMTLIERKDSENSFLSLKNYLGEKDWNQITNINPQRFFGLVAELKI